MMYDCGRGIFVKSVAELGFERSQPARAPVTGAGVAVVVF